MSAKKVIGFSGATFGKQYGLESLFDYHMRVVKLILKKYQNVPQSYFYVDTNAGNGAIPELNLEGSPLIFLRSAIRTGLPYEAHFIDMNDDNAALLSERINEQATVWNADNREALPQICASIKHGSYGMIYHDPNGYPDFDMLTDVFKTSNMQKMDVLIRLSGTSIKRVRGAYPEKYPKTLKEHLLSIPKSKWLIRVSEPDDRSQWTFLFGSNFPSLKDWAKRGFYLTDSSEGATILDELNLSAKELSMKNQTTLGGIQ